MSRGLPPAPAIPMTALQNKLLVQINKQELSSQRLVRRTSILLSAHAGKSNSEIKRNLSISLNTVRSWRSRWNSNYDDLLDYESGIQTGQISVLDYRKHLLNFLSDLARPGAPKTFSLQEEEQIRALACSHPSEHGLPVSSWTEPLLVSKAIEKGIVSSISASQVGRILKK